jgi:hypothetical protein
MLSVSQKSKDKDRLGIKEFSKCLASLENELLKKYCLHNYFDKGTKTIEDFTINFDKSIDNLQPEDLQSHFKQYEQLKKNRSEKEINIFNPEYVLGLTVENALNKF